MPLEMPEVKTFTIEKNKRLPIPAGTKGANVVIGAVKTESDRIAAEAIGRRLVVAAYEKEWGKIPWDYHASITHVHLTFQVITELMVKTA